MNQASLGAIKAQGKSIDRAQLEQIIRAMWADLLPGVEVGPDAQFVALGGNSLKLTQLRSRLESQLGVTVPLAVLFDHQTVSAQVDWLWAHAQPASGMPPMAPVARDGALPVSFSQQRMWLIQKMDPTTTAYNMTLAVRLSGALDRQALDAAVAALVMRHEAFRARFVMLDGQVRQFVDVAAPTAPRYMDLVVPGSSDTRLDQALTLLQEDAHHHFDLEHGPLFNVLLIRTAVDEHVLGWTMHHLISDDWSSAIMMRELAALYNSARQGEAAPLAPKAFDLSDHAAWQQGPAMAATLDRQMAYWEQEVQGLPVQSLPADFQGTRGAALGGAMVSSPIDAELYKGLHARAAEFKVTPFMIMLGCLEMLLARTLQQDDVFVGVPVANRTHPQSESLVGSMVNTVVLRNSLAGDPTFEELLCKVREKALAAFEHQDLPFDRLIERQGNKARSSGVALGLQVLFNVQNAPLGAVAFDGLQWEGLWYDRGATQFPLSISVDTEVTHRIYFEYATTLFDASTARRWLRHFDGLVRQVLADPHQKLSSYLLFDAEDRAELNRWNATAMPVTGSLRIDERLLQSIGQLDRVVLRSPSREGDWTGRQLAERAYRIAHALRQRGIGRGARVGLSIERCSDMLAAVLGVLHSGAAYVPLDPAYPANRLGDMAEDAELAVLITRTETLPTLGWFGGEKLCLDAPQALADQPAVPLEPHAELDPHGDAPAYLIYTSGSTGKPKGVVVPHGAVVNFLLSMAQAPGLTASDRLLAVTTLSFDIAVLELMLPLLQGGQVVLATRDEILDGRTLRALIEQQQITVMQATPSLWRLLLGAGWPGSAGFKALIGGEPLPVDLAESLLQHVGELWNMYGPTETTVWSTCMKVVDPKAGISIGAPIANTEVWVLDPHGQPCAPGQPGEIAIAGLGVTLGYWRRPELTAERFVPDPFRGPPARMYLTGDLGRWRHDGRLEHLGRMDGQIKLRGHRIELGEIEANLVNCPGVRQAVAVAHELAPGDVRLVAHILAEGGQMPAAADLRAHLRAVLPEYMVPQAFVSLDHVPLLPNGKINRKALPVPDLSAVTQAAEKKPASTGAAGDLTPTEQVVAGIWESLLGMSGIEPTDNFFDLGGHSLLAAQVVVEIEKQLGVKLPVRHLIFETLRQIAAGCDRAVPA